MVLSRHSIRVFGRFRSHASGAKGRSHGRLPLAGVVAACGLGAVVLAVVLGGWWIHDPLTQRIAQRLAAPSWVHPLGTDQFGRDVLARLLVGGRWSLLGAVVVCAGTTTVGFTLGTLAACGPRWLDHAICRVTEAFQAVPAVLLALAFTAMLSPSFGNLLLALVLTNWAWHARVYRGMFSRELVASYVEGARAIGVPMGALVLRHILPNVVGPVIVVATANFGAVILNLSALSFVGLGLPPPTPEWGNLVSESRTYFQRAPLLMIAPGACIFLTVMCVNMLGNALRDWLDVRI